MTLGQTEQQHGGRSFSSRVLSALAQIQRRCQVKKKQWWNRFLNGREVTAKLVRRPSFRLVKCGHALAEVLEVEADRSQEEDIASDGQTPTTWQGSMTNNRR